MSEQMTVSEVLSKGADYLAEHGWIKEDYGDETGAACMLGACAAVLGFDPVWFTESDAPPDSPFFRAAEAIRTALELGADWEEDATVEAVVDWNDNYCPDQDYAVALLRAASAAES